MCTGFEIAALAAMAVGTTATLYAQDTQAKQEEANLKWQSAQQAANAEAERGAAQVEAERIRKAAAAQRAQATAAAAASGVDVNSPTAVRINEDITKNSEQDALTTILNANDSSARTMQQSQMDRTGASLARQNGRQAQTATLLSSAANMATYGSRWKTAGGG